MLSQLQKTSLIKCFKDKVIVEILDSSRDDIFAGYGRTTTSFLKHRYYAIVDTNIKEYTVKRNDLAIFSNSNIMVLSELWKKSPINNMLEIMKDNGIIILIFFNNLNGFNQPDINSGKIVLLKELLKNIGNFSRKEKIVF